MIDHHAHPFSIEPGPFDPSAITLDVVDDGGPERRAAQGPTRVAQELLTVRLAARLGCDPADVPDARAEAATDWPGYCRGLFHDAGLTALLVDAGYSPEAVGQLPHVASLSGCEVHPIHRIDPTVDRLIGEGSGAAEIVSAVESEMEQAVQHGAVGFKSILAYRTGLNVDPTVDLAAADRSLGGEGPVRRRGKACRDLVIRRALGLAAELRTPFQFHTGFGDSDLRLSEANPLLLEELLRTPEGSAASVVLIHGSFPWHEELAYLCATRPNVHGDLSLSNIFSPLTTADRLFRLLDLAPAAKLLLGTDGHGEPESFWLAATVLTEAWQQVRSRLSEAGLRREWLDDVEDRLFQRNARELYGLGGP
jgi:predicted TIM-barrel fold metal-dependent hydrolase